MQSYRKFVVQDGDENYEPDERLRLGGKTQMTAISVDV
jgi:hypothetical protein